MSRALFGTDGIRGIAGKFPLDSAGCVLIGKAIGTHFAKPGQTILIASDPRASSETIVEDLSTGLNGAGVNVVSAGIIPTPGLAYLTRENDKFVAGVMVTASHNPAEFNGVKVFDKNGDKLSDATEAELNKLIDDEPNSSPSAEMAMSISMPELAEQYEDFLVKSAGGLRLDDLKIAVDSANGAASGLAERVFERLGASVTPLFDKPDGVNINDGCGATDTDALARCVTDNSLSLGVAVDGDADRVMLIDDQGRQLNGDHMLYILAVTNALDGVVGTVMANLGAEKALTEKGIDFKRVDVGDRYVLEGLAETSYRLGGEQSGHIILPDLLKTGDGLLAAVQIVAKVQQSNKSLAEWRDEVSLLPQALVNIPLPDKSALQKPEVETYIKSQTDKFAGQGRLLIRPSGTEPLARVMVEAESAPQLAQSIASDLKELLA